MPFNARVASSATASATPCLFPKRLRISLLQLDSESVMTAFPNAMCTFPSPSGESRRTTPCPRSGCSTALPTAMPCVCHHEMLRSAVGGIDACFTIELRPERRSLTLVANKWASSCEVDLRRMTRAAAARGVAGAAARWFCCLAISPVIRPLAERMSRGFAFRGGGFGALARRAA